MKTFIIVVALIAIFVILWGTGVMSSIWFWVAVLVIYLILTGAGVM